MLMDGKCLEEHCEIFRPKLTRHCSYNTAKIAVINTKSTSIKNLLYLFIKLTKTRERKLLYQKYFFLTSNPLTFQ